MNIYLDDERSPVTDNNWTIVRSYEELLDKLLIISNTEDKIEEISFDHDLGDPVYDGKSCIKLLVDFDISSNGSIISKDLKYNFHTANPCGRDNMKSYLECYLKIRRN